MSIRFEIHGRIATLTLDRPDKLNALVPEMKAGFEDALARAAEPDVKVLLLRGAGRAFCAGGDIGWMAQALSEGRWEEMETLLDLGASVAHGLATLPKPVVAVVQGPAAGAGMSLALDADLRIATPEAKFSMAFVKIGLHPDWGGSVGLSRLVNPAIAAELMMTGDTLDASQAKALGLVNQVVPADQLEGAVESLARRLAAGPAETFARIKTTLLRNQGLDADSLRRRLEAEGAQMKAAMRHPDAKEGLAAFLEKRAPHFE
ncbi:2-(1,2-epoxy-1,2-dihydrophenyl)acetyl-CoA isomerase [Geothrix limicola]|uniref:2-(1,2-epoxy-1,2-dihydrophenyl)acetyl-CoA isomerase n=1 Tax=Geothrix limicola TaxID=2927978 RepID=A0ABQ5QHT6_9BACT|nr:enoyl-CoA hydratase [Geothrix limicola]GLH74243.1 2-(1,2-epoxy-1,2-dihydrophenyl)acetyl-CoA isomerase [Geothrix limicola]